MLDSAVTARNKQSLSAVKRTVEEYSRVATSISVLPIELPLEDLLDFLDALSLSQLQPAVAGTAGTETENSSLGSSLDWDESTRVKDNHEQMRSELAAMRVGARFYG